MSALKGDSPRTIQNFIGGEYIDPVQTSCKYIPVTTPHTAKVIAQCPVSTAEDVKKAVEVAKEAFKLWRYYALTYSFIFILCGYFTGAFFAL